MYKAKVNITLRPSILDPKGKAAHHALETLGLNQVENVRIGKFIELDVNAETEDAAKSIVKAACTKLLANQVMEDFTIEVEA